MNYRRPCILIALLILICSSSYATLISFAFVETGVSSGVPSTQHSSVWEGGMMEVFFDAGYIVTNSPAGRLEIKPEQILSGSILSDFEEAIMGGAEFFVLGLFECQVESGRATPININMKIFSTITNEMIFDHIFPIDSGRTLAQEFEFAKDVGRIILNQLN